MAGPNSGTLGEQLREEVVRLGGAFNVSREKHTVELLVHCVDWPRYRFNSSYQRYRSINSNDTLSEVEIQDEAAYWSYDFEFAVNGKFYNGWEADFSGTDPGVFYPFGADSHYFYLLKDNSRQPADPLVFRVDHETVPEVPSNRSHVTVVEFLSVLEPAGRAGK